MTSDIGYAVLMCGGIACLIVLSIWALWFLERFRGRNAALKSDSVGITQAGYNNSKKNESTLVLSQVTIRVFKLAGWHSLVRGPIEATS